MMAFLFRAYFFCMPIRCVTNNMSSVFPETLYHYGHDIIVLRGKKKIYKISQKKMDSELGNTKL